jgi:hypothetical protein
MNEKNELREIGDRGFEHGERFREDGIMNTSTNVLV